MANALLYYSERSGAQELDNPVSRHERPAMGQKPRSRKLKRAWHGECYL